MPLASGSDSAREDKERHVRTGLDARRRRLRLGRSGVKTSGYELRGTAHELTAETGPNGGPAPPDGRHIVFT